MIFLPVWNILNPAEGSSFLQDWPIALVWSFQGWFWVSGTAQPHRCSWLCFVPLRRSSGTEPCHPPAAGSSGNPRVVSPFNQPEKALRGSRMSGWAGLEPSAPRVWLEQEELSRNPPLSSAQLAGELCSCQILTCHKQYISALNIKSVSEFPL